MIKAAEISVKGNFIEVPAITVDNVTVIVYGRWLKVATVKDEAWKEGSIVGSPERILKEIHEQKLKADIFSFSQKLPETAPMYKYHKEMDNVAAIPIKSYDDWWNQLSKWTRKNMRRASKRGVVVRKAEHDDNLVKGIVEINNETPFRTGRPFWHYGKTSEQVKKDYSDFLDRSDIFGAYHGEELIGILRLVYMNKIVSILQILCKNSHYDKRPANALIAKAVEVADQKGASHLVYGKYLYDENENSALTEFKRRNGFEKFFIPVYYVPLNIKGRITIGLNLHQGVKRLIPKRMLYFLLNQREKIYRKRVGTYDKSENIAQE